jgi:hypothetical protein
VTGSSAEMRVLSWRGTKPREVTGLGRRQRLVEATDSLVEQRLEGAHAAPGSLRRFTDGMALPSTRGGRHSRQRQ